MTTFTKERLREIAVEKVKKLERVINQRAFNAIREDLEEELELARIALASLEADDNAEPVAFINGAWTLVYYRPPKELGLKIGDKLYTAPSAPVVPDALEQFAEFMAAESIKTGNYPDGWQCKASNAAHEYAQSCRAAMQGKAEPVSQPYKLPEGWIACSERMPMDGFDVLCASEFDGPGDWRRKVGYWHCGKWVVYGASWTPTHWMPLPAAPQQEVNYE